MPTGAKNSFGNALFMAVAGSAVVRVANLRKVGDLDISREFNDVTTQDSTGGAAEFLPSGVYEVGEMTFEGDYIPLSTGDAAMMTAFLGAVLQDFEIKSKAASGLASIKGSGYISNYKIMEHEVGGFQQMSFGIRPTGVWTKAVTT